MCLDQATAIIVESGLEEIWNKLKLTKAEEEVAVFEEEVPSEKAKEIELSLIGKLLTTQNFNGNVMKTVLKNIWKPSKRMVAREMDENLFLFQFFSKKDKDYVLKEGPWAFDGHLLLLKEWTGLEQLSEIKFDKACF